MSERLPSERRATAYHEAGHAVAYLVHRRRFRYVTIRPRHGRGRVAVAPRRIDVFVKGVIAYAGPLAQARYEVSAITTNELADRGMAL